MTFLHNGDTFPSLKLSAVGGGAISLPDDLAGSFGVVLVYRGSWCPFCNAQLSSFSRATATFAELDIKVVALSVDDEASATAFRDKHRIAYPIGHSADPDVIADALGAYVNDEPRYLQSTGFVLAPDGTVVTAVYSSGAIGRLVAEDVVGLVRYARSQS